MTPSRSPIKPFELPQLYVPHPARLNPRVASAREHARSWAEEMGIFDARRAARSSRSPSLV